MPDRYDPQSVDAMFARLLQRMDEQDKTLARIEAHVVRTNGRVTNLERWRDIITTKVAATSAVVSAAVAVAAWLYRQLLG